MSVKYYKLHMGKTGHGLDYYASLWKIVDGKEMHLYKNDEKKWIQLSLPYNNDKFFEGKFEELTEKEAFLEIL